MKLAFVYDRINKFGGAERLLLALKERYPDAPIYTLVHNPKTSTWAKDFKVIPTFLNKIPFLRTRHQLLSPVSPLAFETFNFNDFDVVVSISSAEAKSVITKPQTLHLCYCLTPPRYFWGDFQTYKQDLKMKLLPHFLKKHFRNVDLITSSRPDHYLTISAEVQKRIKKYYSRDSQIIYPPVTNFFFSSKLLPPEQRRGYLLVSRLVPYKKTDLVVKAFNRLPQHQLTIIGTGSELKRLKQLAGPNITFLKQISDQTLLKAYSKAKAVIFPQLEDFGLVPLEAQATGTPVIAFAKGGALETIVSGQTGLFFKRQTSAEIIKTIKQFESIRHQLKPSDCRRQAEKFSHRRFVTNFSDKLESLWQIQAKSQNI